MLMLRMRMTERDMLRLESIFDVCEPPRVQQGRASLLTPQRDPE